jgi:hypothetical protein
MDWLDTETKALLQRSPPEKLAPPDTAAFTLVLLALGGHDHRAIVEAVQRAAQVSAAEAEGILGGRLPASVKKGLSYSDAQIGQFELICCDAISVIIADEVVAGAPADYLMELYAKLQKIDEFRLVTVRIDLLPHSPSGQEFCKKFLGGKEPTAATMKVMRKKARVMQHWATRIGARMSIE